MKKIEDLYELSPTQLGAFYHSLSVPLAGDDVDQVGYVFEGPLDTRAFQEAWRRAVQLHSVLRTSFHWKSIAKPVQVVRREVELPWEEEDWREIPAGEHEARLAALLAADRRRGFDLGNPPLMRLRLVRAAERRHFFLWSFHYTLLDERSAARVLRQVLAPEPALRASRPYRDYILWQQGQDGAETEAFWREAFRGLEVPAPAAAMGKEREGSRQTGLRLTREETAALLSFCEREGLSVETALQGAWALFLGRSGSREDVVFGAQVAGLPPELAGEEWIGLFANILPVRVRLDPQASPASWLRSLEGRRREVERHGYVPLSQVQRWSGMPLDQPLFESLVVLDGAEWPPERPAGDLELRPLRRSETAPHPLTLRGRLADGLELRLLYDGSRFDEAASDLVLERVRTLLSGFAAGTDGELRRIPFLAPGERRRLLEEWNATAADYPRDRLLPELFAEQVERSPSATAVACSGSALSYRQLQERARRIACHLQALGVGAETPVAVFLERSPDLLAALLGVLEAGGFYVPLDPAYPADRLAFMLADAGPRVLLTERRLTGLLPKHGAQLLVVDEIPGGSAEKPATGASPDNLAYTIYTSGSTGRPKGVQIAHRSLVNLLLALKRQLGMHEKDVLLAVTTVSFDIAGLELFLPLIAGGRVELAGREEVADGVRLASRIEASSATLMQATPATWQLLSSTGWQGSSQLQILCGGEALSRDLARWLRERCAALWNVYGPTETTIWSATWRVPASPEEAASSQEPLGHPIANTRIHVLDRSLEPVPPGVAGELYIGGDGLARGYLGRPDLSAERFVPDGLGHEPGARLYRTGDLARYRADGVLEFLGRADQQVKIRGFRIEPGEVEVALAAHPGVRQAAVVARPDASGMQSLAAYFVAAGSPAPTLGDLREFLRERLPEPMVPSVFVALEALPLTPGGKVDRRALPDPGEDGLRPAAVFEEPRTRAETRIAGIWKELLQRSALGVHDSFFDLGGHSLLLGKLLVELRDAFDCDLEMIDLFQHPTISAMAAFLAGREEVEKEVEPEEPAPIAIAEPAEPAADGIAVIAVAGRFPGATNPQELWRRIAGGEECITSFSDEDLIAAGVPESALGNPDLVKARGIVEGIELFDADFFGMSPAEAEITDPQHRLFLEVAWEALESAGYNPETYPGAIGVFAGCSYSTYWLYHLYDKVDLSSAVGHMQVALGNDKDFLATRASYKLNLKGPSLGVQTACSTSLVAIHQACQSLLEGGCDMALTGGSSIVAGQRRGYLYQEEGILSPDGHCRAFDAKARGTVPGSGVGAVLLKRLDRALADGDFIHAVIKGSAINNDGSCKMGFTAPSIDGQRQAVAQALARARVDPETVTLIEAHGTGTELGDPIEIAALRQAFGTSRKGYCAIGSVKTNVGHLDVAAGVTGFIKAVLALEHKALPPSLHYESPNPGIDLEDSPFYVNTRLAEWRNGNGPRRAGVSSFGLGGTNAHVVLEEAPFRDSAAPSRSHQLLLLSARSEAALDAAAARLADHLRSQPEVPFADVAFTLQTGRKAFKHRCALVCGSREEAIELLEGREPGRVASAVRDAPQDRPVVFLFPGQGSQRAGMTRELYASEPVFRREIDGCAERLAPHLGADLREELHRGTDDRLSETWLTQPALFAVEYALARLWMSWGVRPRAMIGHSIGEYTAACLAGVFSLEAALDLVAHRGRLMQQMPRGAMLAVALSPDAARSFLGNQLSLAAVNEPGRSVISGPLPQVEALERELSGGEVFCRRLRASHAFHSGMMEPILADFEKEAERAKPQAPRIPFVSNLTGTWITARQATDASYWSRHLRETVLFGQGVRELFHASSPILLEVGPGKALSDAVLCRADRPADLEVIPSLAGREETPEPASLLQALGSLWLAGAPVDWAGFYAGERRCRVPLPTYPFQRKRHWIERSAVPARQEPQEVPAGAPAVADRRSDRILSRLRDLYARLTGRAAQEISESVSFLDMGMDSLRLLQASHEIVKELGVKLPFRRLMEDLSTLSSLAGALDEILPPDALPAPVPVPAAQPVPAAAPLPPPQSDLQALLAQQLDAMNRQSQALTQVIAMQLNALGGGGPIRPSVPVPGQAPRPPIAEVRPATSEPAPYVPYQRIQTGTRDLTPRQQDHLEALIARLSVRMAGSKRLAQEARPFLADSRGPMGFRLLWKELVFPLYAQRGQGSRIWDVDGNEYVDLIMGFGALLLGHSPAFIAEALREQSGHGLLIGMESPYAGKAAQLICEMTGNERASFTNSGTEAVMAAIRLARARTGRTRIAVFEGGYHGFSDDVLVLPSTGLDGRPGSVPMAPGIPPHVADSVMVLKYCHPESLEILRGCAHELAAIVIEPQQSRRPGSFDTRSFLHGLRKIADESGAALVLDEVITGFRIHQGGAQKAYGIRADIVTYGKGIGVGVPAGVVAGKAEYLDAIDGGMWSYGDDSLPQAEVTFIAGTYFKHPLTMPAIWAVLNHMKERGPALQEGMTAKAERLARELNGYFDGERLPMRVLQSDSICSLHLAPEVKHPPLFFYHLLENGVYALNRRPIFLSAAHTDEDLDLVLDAVRKSVDALREGDLLPAGPAGLRRPARPRRLPATEAQRELFTLARMGDDASRAYNESLKLLLRGPLRTGVLRQALREVVERHEAVRATFGEEGDDLWIHPSAEVDLPLDDLSGLAPDAREARAEELLQAEADRTFDLVAGPLFRFRLLRLGQDDHVLAATFSHLVVDGLSIDVLFGEAFAIYAALCRGEEPQLAAPTPFAEFAGWLRNRQDGADLEAAESFWLGELAGVPLLELPADHPRPALKTYHGDWRSLWIDQPLLDDLQRLSMARRCTLFVTLFASFHVLLHRLSGQSDLVAATASAGQVPMGGERLVGHCVNLLSFRSRLAEDARFVDLIPAVRGKLFDVYEHQHYPFNRLMRGLGLQGSAGRPLVAAAMNLDSHSSRVSRVLDLSVEGGANPSHGAKFELLFELAVYDDGIRVHCTYQTDLFLGGTVERWLEYFRNVLAGVAARPEELLWRLSFLPEAERRQVLAEWSGTVSPYERDACVHELFALAAERTPDAVAVVCGEACLTYGELDARSNQLARYLQGLGVGPEVSVGVSMERSMEMVVALVGILKAGGAYLALDPSYPAERLAFMMEEARVSVLLTRETGWEAVGRCSPAPVRSGARADNLAYTVYTSGSTGRPKGVQVTHRNVVRLARNAGYARLGPDEVILQLAPVAFDASTFEVWGSLLNGGRLALLPAGVPSLEELGRAIQRHGVTTLFITTGLFHQMVEERLGDLGSVRQLLTGGEVLSVPHVRKAVDGLRQGTLIACYGPTENTTFTTCDPLSPGNPIGPSVPLGRPIVNNQVFILDRRLEPVPVGVPGQLCAGGDGLARGYLGRPGLTAERFIPHPFSSGPGERLYLTGDLVRWSPDGRIEFLGRFDDQVKIRGFRVEPGEVEAILGLHPGVQAAVVLVQADAAGGKRLVAYLAVLPDEPLETGELVAFLKTRLPEYMVPAAFVRLESFPLNVNGKVDRKALADMGSPRSGSGEEVQAPRTPEEARLAQIWGEVLGVERVGVHDDFFALGGHSLLATRLVSRIGQAFGVSLPLRALFEAPTVAGLVRRVAADAGRPVLPPIERVPRGKELLASFAQQRLWFVNRLMGGRSPFYNITMAWRLSGALDEPALAGSLAEILRRHEVLRTSFVTRGGEPMQRISPQAETPLRIVDLQSLGEAAREAELRRIVVEEARQPFNLRAAPLIRSMLVRLRERESALQVTMHHIAADGWSLGVFSEELTALYRGLAHGRPSPLPELPVQYADFAAWQRGWLAGEVLERQLDFWARRLDGIGSLELPRDRPRPALQTFRGESLTFRWPAALLGDLHSLSQGRGATLFMTLLAAFQVLLSRWTGQPDVVVGSPVAGRGLPETERMIGLFVNTLALRADIWPEDSFHELLDRAIDGCLEAYAHQDLPFEKLVEHIRPERDLSRNPVFQVIFALQNAPLADAALEGLSLSPLAVETKSTRFDLEAHLHESRGELHGTFAYDRDLFDGAAMGRLARHFRRLAEAIAAEPGRPVSELPLLDEEERQHLLGALSGEDRPLPPRPVVHELFEARAAESPGRIAVVFEDLSLTYGDLDARANQVARRLRRLGVGPGDRVAVAMDRCLEMPVALLGVLKAGAAFVPIDSGYPQERRDFMLRDCRTRALVTLGANAPTRGLPVLDLREDREGVSRESPRSPGVWADPDGLAYVMYTSGSTGAPKGVAVAHRAIVRLVHGSNFASFGPEDTFLQQSPLAFDASTLEIWGPLLNGGRLAVAPPSSLSLEDLGRAIARHGVNALWLTAGLFRQMVDENLEGLRPVRTLLAGGDVLSVPHVERVLRELPGTVLVNGYGPTENTTFTCCHRLQGPQEIAGSVPIGRPIANTRVYLAGRDGSLVPEGVAGELLTGGAGLARDYLDRPALTAERFVPDPFGPEPGGRLYRTGDLARWRAEGTLQFLGRIDDQVKVRGFRVEPGEIEAALLGHERVRQAAVVALPDPSGNLRLAAYVVAEGPRSAAAELAEHLGRSLPPHMAPSFFVFLDGLPLTPNGKLDRRALPAPETAAAPEQVRQAPRGALEATLAEIWRRVLGVETVGVQDDFFALGGHSLLATQVIAYVRKELDLDVELRVLFEEPTVAGFAAWIEREIPGASTPLIRPVVRGGDLPLSFAQQRLWFLDQLTPENPSYNVVAAWKLVGPLRAGTLRRALGEIVRRHEALRTRILTRAGQPSQVIDPPGEPALLMVDLAALDAESRRMQTERLASEEGLRPFDLERGPLLRAILLRSSGEESVLLVNMHHVVSDGWSLGILEGELAALYEVFLHGRPSPLPELPFQYADFAVWQRAWLSGPELEKQVGYWKRQLVDAAVLALPADHSRLPLQAFRAGALPVRIPPAVSRPLQALSRGARATLYMTLLAAFQALLRRWTGQRDIVVGSPIANRNQPETDKLIGFFVNTLAMRSNVAGDPSFPKFLERTVEVCLEAHAHQDLPFEKLVDSLQIERHLSRNPLFQAVFALQNTTAGALGMADLEVQPFSENAHTTRFDLEVHLWDKGDWTVGVLLYDKDLFEERTVERLLMSYLALLAGIVENPERRLSELPLLGEAEARQMLSDWNDERAEYDREVCLHHLFEAQAARSADAVAVVSASGSLTYGELNAWSNRLAHRLGSLGVGPRSLVGVCIDPSPEMVVALMGVLKAGGAYVPIDPGYPRERIEYILRDIEAPVYVTSSRIAAGMPGLAAVPVCLDGDGFAGMSAENPPRRTGADDLAYVIFTSGSTGRPKGVVLQHRPVVNLIEWVNRTFGVGPADRVLQVASMTFDLSVYDTFGLLAAGGSVRVASEEELKDPRRLAAILDSDGITFWDSAPAALQQLVPFLPEEGQGSPSLRLAFLSGDWIPLTLPPVLLRAFLNVRVIGLGGATEAAIWSNWHAIEEIRPEWVSIPYGRAIQNARYYVLDADLQPCPMGVAGDLYIGGECLSLGYFNQPALTAERYVPDPFGGRPGGVLYATGDRARWKAAGHIEFLGRLDAQVKLRGYRIELGEVEAVLAEHPAVHHAVALVREDQPGMRRLVAYAVTGREEDPALTEELRELLKSRLPSYMVPSAVVTLASLPLTPNGKVDRKALPVPDRARGGEGGPTAPRTPIEARLAEIWSTVLRRDTVGVEDNFFEIGGDSILGIQVVAKALRAGLSVSPKQMFEHQTISELAAALGSGEDDPGFDRLPGPDLPFALARLDPATLDRLLAAEPEIADLYPLSPMQRDMLVHSLAFPRSDVNVLQLVWSPRGRLDIEALRQAWRSVIARHDALRTTFRWEGLEEPHQAVLREVELPWQEHDWRDLPAGQVKARLAAFLEDDRARAFRLDGPPPSRLSFLRLADGSGYLVWSVHHALLDGWSLALVEGEVSSFYEALREGREPEPAPAPAFRSYIAWLGRQDLERAEAFWRETLRGVRAPTPLWIDRLPPAIARRDGFDRRSLRLAAGPTAGLQRLARRSRVTPSTVLQGAWALLLARYSGQDEVVFGITVSGRAADLDGSESMVGLFLNNLPARVPAPPDACLAEWLGGLQGRASELWRYEHTPQSEVRSWSEVPGALPLYDSVVVFGNFPSDPAAPEALASESQLQEDWGVDESTYFGARTSSRLTLISQPAARLPLHLVYESRSFDPATVDRALGHLATLLQGLAEAEADQPLGGLPLLTGAEQQQLLRADPLLVDERGRLVPVGVPGVSGEESWRLARRLPDGSLQELGDLRRTAVAAGQRLLPEIVEAALCEHPVLSEAAVLIREARPGEPCLAAYAVAAREPAPGPAEIQGFLRERLPWHLLPQELLLVPELPRRAGEVDREALQALAPARSAGRLQDRGRNLLFQDSLEVQLLLILEEVFQLRPIDADASFFDLGGNSVLAVSLVDRIERRLGIDLPLSALFERSTARGLARALREQAGELPWQPLVKIKPSGSRPPFFCVHAAGGNVLGFVDLVRHVDPDQPFYALQSIGLDGRQEPSSSIEEMAARYVDEIRTVQPRGPYLLGGHSFGGYVAHEMACQLERQGEQVALLAELDSWSPIFEGRPVLGESIPDDLDILVEIAEQAAGRSGAVTREEVAARESAGRLDFILERIHAAGAETGIDRGRHRRLLKIQMSAIEAMRTWVPRSCRARIVVFRALEEDPGLIRANRHPALGTPELHRGWSALTSEPVQVLDVPGSHGTMVVEPHVRVLAERLEESLARGAEEERVLA